MLKNITSKFQLSGCNLLLRVSLLLLFITGFQQAHSQDMGADSLIAPASPMCAASNQTLIVNIKNFDAATIDYSIDTVIVTVSISGASTQTYSDTLVSGTLDFDSIQAVTVTTMCDLTASGVHILKAYTSILSSDASVLNDTLPLVSITVNPFPATPTITVYDTTVFCTGDSAILVSSSTTDNLWTGGSTNDSLTVYTSGPYTVAVTSAGCTSLSDTTTITVNSYPAMPTITTSDTVAFCTGGSVILYSSSATGNTWTGGSTADSLIVTTNGSYSVTVTLGGCATVSDDTAVTVHPLPTVTLASFATNPCSDDAPFALTGGSPAGGTFSGIGVTGGNMFNPASAGAIQGITYTYVDVNGCANSATKNMTVVFCTGIEEFTSEGITVYPNPTTTGILTIAISNANFIELGISIVDMQGKEVYNSLDKNISADYSKQINITQLAKGIYYIKLSTESDVKIQKLIVE